MNYHNWFLNAFILLLLYEPGTCSQWAFWLIPKMPIMDKFQCKFKVWKYFLGKMLKFLKMNLFSNNLNFQLRYHPGAAAPRPPAGGGGDSWYPWSGLGYPPPRKTSWRRHWLQLDHFSILRHRLVSLCLHFLHSITISSCNTKQTPFRTPQN